MGFDWIASPACTELEQLTMDWLCGMLGLPRRWRHDSAGPGGGVIQGSAGESAIVVSGMAIPQRLHRRWARAGPGLT
eukprot:COSAG01_NODE_40078_length_468_cov_0.626016_1_plen_77_part_00